MEQIKNLKSLKELFKFSADVIFQTYNFFQHKVHFITCDSMIDEQLLNGVVVTRVQSLLSGLSTELLEIKIMNDLHIPKLQKVKKNPMLLRWFIQGMYCCISKKKTYFSQVIFQKNQIEIQKKP